MSARAFNFDPKVYQLQLQKAVRVLKKHLGTAPPVAIIFGSGLGEEFLRRVRLIKAVAFAKIPRFYPTSVQGHAGRVLKIQIGKATALVLQGRHHYYEGYAPEQVVFALRALLLWGVQDIILTNASGSVNPRMRPGDLVWIQDHLNFTGANPLRGPNLDFLGPRFPSLAQVYRNAFSQKIRRAAAAAKVPLKAATYVGISGPSYETAAEVQAFRSMGGDIVGMSTVYEAIAAAHAGRKVAALSAVTNSCLDARKALRHEEVLSTARRVDRRLSAVLLKFFHLP